MGSDLHCRISLQNYSISVDERPQMNFANLELRCWNHVAALLAFLLRHLFKLRLPGSRLDCLDCRLQPFRWRLRSGAQSGAAADRLQRRPLDRGGLGRLCAYSPASLQDSLTNEPVPKNHKCNVDLS